MRTAASGLVKPKSVALARPRAKATATSGCSARKSSRATTTWPSRSFMKGAVISRNCRPRFSRPAWKSPQRAIASTLFWVIATAAGAHADREPLDVLVRIDAARRQESPGHGHRAGGERRDPDRLAAEIGHAPERAFGGNDDAEDGDARDRVERLDLDALLAGDEGGLRAHRRELDVPRRELLDAGRRSFERGDLEVQPLGLPVAERLGDRRVGGETNRDVLGRDRIDGLLRRLLLSDDVLGGDDGRQREGGAEHDEAESSLHVKSLHQAPTMWSACAQKMTRRWIAWMARWSPTPSAARSSSTANIPAMSSEVWNWRIRLPSPRWEPTNSPTMAPSTLKTMAMSSPANTNGSALGNVTYRNVCQRLAASERMGSRVDASTVLRPTMTLTRMGKNATSAATTTLEVTPYPSHTLSSGAIAILGKVCSATRYG